MEAAVSVSYELQHYLQAGRPRKRRELTSRRLHESRDDGERTAAPLEAASKFAVLGPFEVNNGVAVITPTAPKLRELLALLAIRSNQLIPTSSLIEELWGERPPVSALTTLQTYIYQLRKILSAAYGPEAGVEMLITKHHGYYMQISANDVDANVFAATSAKGRRALEDGEDERAGRLLADALALWRGPVLCDVLTGSVLGAQATRLQEAQLRTLELRIEADLRLGKHHELISELKMLIADHPLNEGMHAKLMLSLYRAERRIEAIDVYRRLRKSLVSELALEPSAALRRLHQRMLSGDPSLDYRPSGQARLRAVPAPPAQLPPAVGDFVGRTEEIRCLSRALEGSGRPAMPIALICGPPGSGKTELAVQVGHRLRSRFPGGQFQADLRGVDSRPAEPSEILARLLRSVGVSAEDLPGGIEARIQMFRTWCADRRVLLLLDDAASVAQVRPLLPGGSGCGAIVTSRWLLTGLPGTRTVSLGELSLAEGVTLLGTIVGGERVEPERQAAERIVRSCGYLPLAIRAAAARLVAASHWSLGRLAAALEDGPDVLGQLTMGDLDVRASIERSYRQLGEDERQVLTALSLLPFGNFLLQDAAAALNMPADHAEEMIARLCRAHLADVMITASPAPRYRLWRLVREFARERVAAGDLAAGDLAAGDLAAGDAG